MQQTTNLGLNKPEPNDYADIAKINENMDKLDAAVLLAIAAAGAYSTEKSYAVGDYCTYGGKLRKCSTAIPSGETWTESHWTTTTVAAEMKELSSQLSNKLNTDSGITMLGDVNSPDDMPDKQSALFRTTNSDWNGRLPAEYAAYARLRSGFLGSYDLWIAASDSGLWYCMMSDEQLPESTADWIPVALGTPPQEFDLSLAEGWTGTFKYCKTQENIVVMNFEFRLDESGSCSDSTILSVIPAGFRPSHSCIFAVSVQQSDTRFSALLQMSANGNIIYYGTAATSRPFRIYGAAIYLSAS